MKTIGKTAAIMLEALGPPPYIPGRPSDGHNEVCKEPGLAATRLLREKGFIKGLLKERLE